MSTVAEIEEAIARLPSEDFSRLIEDLRDIESAREALAEASSGSESPRKWREVREELDDLHG